MGRLFLWGSGGYLLGHLLVDFSVSTLVSIGLLCLALTIVCGWLVSWRGSLVLFLTLLTSGIGYSIAHHHDAVWQQLSPSFDQSIRAVVVKRASVKTFYQPITLEPINNTLPTRVLWRAPEILTLVPGQTIELDCIFKQPTNFNTQFDYVHYLATERIGYVCEHERNFALLLETVTWRSNLFQVQNFLRIKIRTFLPDPAAGLLEGLFLGGDAGLSQKVSDAFRRAGLSHIIAVSGYNMSLITLAVLFIALLSGLWRQVAALFATFGILLFLLLIDTSAASLRAACMAWIVFFAFFVGRPANAWNGLFLAGLLMTITNPYLVRYDVGFQLSFLATLALIAASPWFEVLVEKSGWWWKVLTLLLSTVVIELFIFPVQAFNFGTLSLLAPLVNLLVLPLIPLTMFLGFVMLFFGSLVPSLGFLFSFPVWILLTLVIKIAEGFAGLPWGFLKDIHLSQLSIALWYIVLMGVVWYSRTSFKRYVLRMDH